MKAKPKANVRIRMSRTAFLSAEPQSQHTIEARRKSQERQDRAASPPEGAWTTTGTNRLARASRAASTPPSRRRRRVRAISACETSMPDARIVYVSATGAYTIQGLDYASRLGLWATDETCDRAADRADVAVGSRWRGRPSRRRKLRQSRRPLRGSPRRPASGCAASRRPAPEACFRRRERSAASPRNERPDRREGAGRPYCPPHPGPDTKRRPPGDRRSSPRRPHRRGSIHRKPAFLRDGRPAADGRRLRRHPPPHA